jgi:predicted transcriptional regulator
LPKREKGGRQEAQPEISLDLILSVLGQSTRLEILRELLQAEAGCGVTALSKELSVKAPTVEKHLAILRQIGLVKKQMTLELARERWMIRGKKRVASLLKVIDSEVMDLVIVGHYFEQVEKDVRKQQYYKEHGASVQEMQQARKDGEKLDRMLEKLSKQYAQFLDEDELKKINYWMNARSLGVL